MHAYNVIIIIMSNECELVNSNDSACYDFNFLVTAANLQNSFGNIVFYICELDCFQHLQFRKNTIRIMQDDTDALWSMYAC